MGVFGSSEIKHGELIPCTFKYTVKWFDGIKTEEDRENITSLIKAVDSIIENMAQQGKLEKVESIILTR